MKLRTAETKHALLHYDTILAVVSALTLRASFGPAHYTSVEPVIAKLHQALAAKAGNYIIVEEPDIKLMQREIAHTNPHWDWLKKELASLEAV